MVFINRSHVLILFVNFSVVGGCDDTYYGKETLAQVLSCELCEISKNTIFTKHLWTTAFKAIFTFGSF